MSDYSKITNFLSKDSLTLNDPAKYVKGSEIDAEFNAIAVAVATKANTDSPTLTTPTLGVATATSLQAIIGNVTPAAGTFTALTATGAFTSLGLDDNATAVALTLSGSGANSITIANSATNPTIGTSGGALNLTSSTGPVVVSGAVAQGFTIQSNTTGTSVLTLGNATNAARGQVSADNAGELYLSSFGVGAVNFYTAGGTLLQVQVINTASADRYITLTGSNGGNPAIGVSAGALALQSATGQINIVAGAAALNATLNISCTGVSGCGIQLAGNGATTPNKFIRSFNGNFEIVDSGFAAAIVQISDVGSIAANTAIAIPAGGTAGVGLKVSSTANFGVFFGSGAPSLSAAKGSLYLRSDGSATNNRMYVNTDGGTTWTAVTTAA